MCVFSRKFQFGMNRFDTEWGKKTKLAEAAGAGSRGVGSQGKPANRTVRIFPAKFRTLRTAMRGFPKKFGFEMNRFETEGVKKTKNAVRVGAGKAERVSG
jgi:hypothetical protein